LEHCISTLIFSQMIKIALQLCPVVRPDFIVELLHEKTFRDLGSGFVVKVR